MCMLTPESIILGTVLYPSGPEEKRGTDTGDGGVTWWVGEVGRAQSQVLAQSLQLCPSLWTQLWTVAHQTLCPWGFSKQEYWVGLPCPPPGDLPDSRTEPNSLMSPALAGEFFTTRTTCIVLLFYVIKQNKTGRNGAMRS